MKVKDPCTIKGTGFTGVVVGAAVDDEGNYLFRVAYKDADGKDQVRYFTPDQLQ